MERNGTGFECVCGKSHAESKRSCFGKTRVHKFNLDLSQFLVYHEGNRTPTLLLGAASPAPHPGPPMQQTGDSAEVSAKNSKVQAVMCDCVTRSGQRVFCFDPK